jgi:hypothetical protein
LVLLDWRAIVQNRLPFAVIGTDRRHRLSLPVYAASGIETIVVNEDLPSVVKYVAKAISSTRHVRATVFLTRNSLSDEHDYPEYRR